MAEGRGFVLRPGEGRAIDLGNFQMSLEATGEETDSAFSLLEAAEPADFGPPLHIHHDAAEAFYVLEGEYIIFLDRREYACPAGSFIFIPAGIPHGFRLARCHCRRRIEIQLPTLVGIVKADTVAEGLCQLIELQLEALHTGPIAMPPSYICRKLRPRFASPVG
jgi:mannose-6-phosphate isomerase-like protein (cupin superfamily)